MAYKIIGVHGLANKPEEKTLRQWWKRSILEGLKRNCGNTEQKLEFEIVYWADINYPAPTPDSQNSEPYIRAAGNGKLQTYKDGWRDEVVAGVLAAVIDDERDSSRPQNRRHFFGLGEDSPRIGPFVTELCDSGSAISQSARHRGGLDAHPGQQPRIDDRIKRRELQFWHVGV